MKVETYRCDSCGKQKGETNHWWEVTTTGAKLGDTPSLLVVPIGKTADGKYDAISHLCGAECVQRKVNEFLGGVK